MIEKYLCIKEVLLEKDGIDYFNYKNYFKLYNVYDFVKDGNNVFPYPYSHESLYNLDFYHFDLEEMNDFFITLNEWRELKINKILEND